MDQDRTDGEKLILSLLMAVTMPWVIAVLINVFFIKNPFVMIVIGLGLMFYTLKAGFQKNSDFEVSLGAIFGGQLTHWVIPSGISWWFPPPIGLAIKKKTTERQTLDRSIQGGKPFVQVKTRDGGTMEIGVVASWGVVNLYNAAQYSDEDLIKQVNALLDRGVRLYPLYFDSDEDIVPGEDTALANQKITFSKFLVGTEIPEGGFRSAKDKKGDSVTIPNDMKERAEALGIMFYSIDVVDINEPAAVQDARNREAAEHAQSAQEKLDIASIRNRILELMWNTSDETAVEAKMAAGKKPLMSEEEANLAVRTARGDIKQIVVSGTAGDFSKGSAIEQLNNGGSNVRTTHP